MRLTILLFSLLLTGALTTMAQDSSAQGAAPSSSATLTGCVKGSNHQYYLVEQNGHRHTLMASNQDLSSYVGHEVTVTGKADTTRSPGGSDAEGHRKGFFSVDSVSDKGACTKK